MVTPKIDWYSELSKIMNSEFTTKQYNNYKLRLKSKLKIFRKFLRQNSKILEIGCGFGYNSIPLSNFGYKLTCLDNDRRVIAVFKKNAEKFGHNIKIIENNAFKIDKIFHKNSFAACISGGLLEHFNKNKINLLIKKQLKLAPLVIADVPIVYNKREAVSKYADINHKICKDGIFRNLWTAKYWRNNILSKYKLVYFKTSLSSKYTGQFLKLTFIVKR